MKCLQTVYLYGDGIYKINILPEARCLQTADRLAWTEISKACLLVSQVLQFTNVYTHATSNHITWNLQQANRALLDQYQDNKVNKSKPDKQKMGYLQT
jgi:hypothetical protein